MVALHDPSHFSEGVVLLSEDLAYLLQFMDGSHSALDLRAAYMRRFGSFLFEEQLAQLLRMLDEQLLLDNERFARHRRDIEEAFHRAPVRESAHAGQSYPADPEELRQQLGSYCQDAKSSSPASEGAAPGGLKGCVVPHIDVRAGGRTYGAAYRWLAAAGPADLYVVVGTCHGPLPSFCAGTRKHFHTPLGLARTDQSFMDALARQWGEDLYLGELAHRSEHTIEFQVIFLQHLFGAEVHIAPLLCAFSPADVLAENDSGKRIREFAEALRAVSQAFAGRLIMVASADLSHVGPRYGDPWSVDRNRLAVVRQHDQELLKFVTEGNAEAMVQTLASSGDRFRVCGFPPIYTMLKAMDVQGGVVLDHRHAHMDESGSVVTFAAVVLF
ncbi:MAG: AmmeMemoRadiSam system protein B [Candidatus Oleimicrobiaceae bacterium]